MKPRALFVAEAEIFPSIFGAAEREALSHRLDFVAPPLTAEELITTRLPIESAEILLSSWSPPLMDETVLARLPRLRAVFHAAGSVKPLVTDALWRRNIRVSSAARVNAIPVADFTLSQIVFCLKHGWQRTFEVRSGQAFRREDETVVGTYGSTVGLISLGHTGRLVADRLRMLEITVIAHDPFVSPAEAAKLGLELCDLDELFMRSDVVSCHTPLLPETRHMIRGEHFAQMRSGASFINTARAPVVNEKEMVSVLARRPDLWAVLDVTDPEPPPADSPLRQLPNVVITPHIAGSLGHEYLRIGRMVVDEVTRFLDDRPLLGEVTPDRIPLIA
jgi:phosphoglycerate dehydrogenase-like enzyme